MVNDQRVHIRWMIRRDMAEVLLIESAQNDPPWNDEEILTCLRHKNVIGMVGEINDKVLAYMIYELYKDRLDVVRLAVHPEFLRRGVGSQMIDKLFGKLSSHRRTRIRMAVNERHLGAQLFLKARGFMAESVERAHFENGDAAYHFAYRLAAEPAPMALTFGSSSGYND
jgi:ribosomal-protein-alanine N-acetyltransferase